MVWELKEKCYFCEKEVFEGRRVTLNTEQQTVLCMKCYMRFVNLKYKQNKITKKINYFIERIKNKFR